MREVYQVSPHYVATLFTSSYVFVQHERRFSPSIHVSSTFFVLYYIFQFFPTQHRHTRVSICCCLNPVKSDIRRPWSPLLRFLGLSVTTFPFQFLRTLYCISSASYFPLLFPFIPVHTIARSSNLVC